MTSVESNSESRRIEDYLRGRLNDEDTRQFEMRMLEDDELFARVQREDLLRQGMAEEPSEASEPKSKPWWRGGAGERGPLMRWLQPALTTALAVAVVGLGIANLELSDRLGEFQAPRTGVPVITLHDQRALLPDMDTDAAPMSGLAGPVLLEIDVSAYDEPAFNLEIRMDDKRLSRQGVRPDERGYLTILAPNAGALQGLELLDSKGRMIRDYNFDSASTE